MRLGVGSETSGKGWSGVTGEDKGLGLGLGLLLCRERCRVEVDMGLFPPPTGSG